MTNTKQERLAKRIQELGTHEEMDNLIAIVLIVEANALCSSREIQIKRDIELNKPPQKQQRKWQPQRVNLNVINSQPKRPNNINNPPQYQWGGGGGWSPAWPHLVF